MAFGQVDGQRRFPVGDTERVGGGSNRGVVTATAGLALFVAKELASA